jgi:hypothetical protein
MMGTVQRARGVATLGLLGAPALVLLAVSCLLDGFNRVDAEPAPAPAFDAGADAGQDADDADAPVSCAHAGFPSPPDAAPGGAIGFVVAVRSIEVRSQPDGGPVGLDIDETCTCQGQGPSCVAPEGADSCDLAEGRDNEFANLFEAIGYGMNETDVSAYYSGLAEQGHWSLLVRVRDYNGEPDDGRVEVALFVPYGFPGVDAGPTWTGYDSWYVSADCIEPLDAGPDAGDGAVELVPRYVDENAYVRGGVLVAGVHEATLLFGGSTTRMELHATAINVMARVVREGNGLWALTDGLLTGILPLGDVFRALGSFRDGDGFPVCTDQGGYEIAKEFICNGADLLSTFSDPKLDCDSMSMGIAFEAVEAKLGEVMAPPDATPGCPADTDPANDQCP